MSCFVLYGRTDFHEGCTCRCCSPRTSSAKPVQMMLSRATCWRRSEASGSTHERSTPTTGCTGASVAEVGPHVPAHFEFAPLIAVAESSATEIRHLDRAIHDVAVDKQVWCLATRSPILLCTHLSVKQVAAKVGLSSLSSFCRRFRIMFGASPTAYQHERRGPRATGQLPRSRAHGRLACSTRSRKEEEADLRRICRRTDLSILSTEPHRGPWSAGTI